MTDLPAGWTTATLGEVATSVKNGVFVSRPGREPDGVPILRISAVRPGSLELDDVRYSGLMVEELSNSGALLQSGDLLFTRYNGNIDFVGACALVPQGVGSLTYPDKLIRVQVNEHLVCPSYANYAFQAPLARAQIRALARTTAGQAGISGSNLRSVEFPLPPLVEQRRIVAALEDYLSRLDAGVASVRRVRRRLNLLVKRIIVDAVPIPGPDHWKCVTVSGSGSVDLGRQRHPEWHTGEHMRPYPRVANVFEDRIDLSDVMEMNFPPDVFERFRLVPGDILLNEGQSPEYLGRPAMYRGVPKEIAFTNSLLRFKAKPGIHPEWALLVFRRHMHAKRFVREVRITTNIAHLSAARFKSVEFPIPPLGEQMSIVEETKRRLDYVDRMSVAADRSVDQARNLRRAVLTEAFAGRLVPQDPNDEPAAELLARIRAERAAAVPVKRQRAARAPRTRKELAAPPTRVTGDNYEQGALPL